jgi:hypothetical protein
MKRAKSTSRPWSEVIDNDYHSIQGKDGSIVCDLTDGRDCNADASLIVKAVNNYERLLEACREALNYIEDDCTTADLIRKAILKAEGK